MNQIAAGEVVERPASVVKELVENALDAGASRIAIRLDQSGRKLIEVADDGVGMDLSEIQLAIQRHATSKIRTAADLARAATLGFRGEAIPSIASVSLMSISSSQDDGVRSVVEVEGGEVREPTAEPGSRGTTVRVEDLFFNTPARLKFLRTDATELAACVEIVSKYAVARPDVAFRLSHGTVDIVETTGSGDPLTALAEVWGRDIARALAPLDTFNGTARVRGFVSPPHFTKPNRNFQWVFVNGRPVRSRTVVAALDQAFRSLTPERRYPVAVLDIRVDPEQVDVNVSPTKSEVRFHQSGAIFDAVRRSVREGLLAVGMVPNVEGLAVANLALVESRGLVQGGSILHPGQFGGAATSAGLSVERPGAAGEPSLEIESRTMPDMLRGLRILAQISDTFIVAENDDALLIVDQHVAHERVLYEMLLRGRGSTAIEVQPLLTPETLQVDKRSAELLEEKLDELKAVGFELERFGNDTFLVRTVPAVVRNRNPMQVLRDLVDELVDGGGQGCLVPTRDEVYILCACKMAVKAGDKLGVPEMERLLRDLAETENPYLCPHGRPITIVMPKSDIRRRFKR